MISELETVVLTHDIPDHGLKTGDVGTIVHRYKDESHFEVEFVAAGGKTIATITLSADGIRPMSGAEILHVRKLAS